MGATGWQDVASRMLRADADRPPLAETCEASCVAVLSLRCPARSLVGVQGAQAAVVRSHAPERWCTWRPLLALCVFPFLGRQCSTVVKSQEK